MGNTIRTNRDVLRAYRRMLQETCRAIKKEIKDRQRELNAWQGMLVIPAVDLETCRGNSLYQDRIAAGRNLISKLQYRLDNFASLVIAAEGNVVTKPARKDPNYGREHFVPARFTWML